MPEPSRLREIVEAETPRQIFRKWEMIRIAFNLLLVVECILLAIPSVINPFLLPAYLVLWLLGFVAANIAFLAAPGAETYVLWLGVPRTFQLAITVVLFLGGVFITSVFAVVWDT